LKELLCDELFLFYNPIISSINYVLNLKIYLGHLTKVWD